MASMRNRKHNERNDNHKQIISKYKVVHNEETHKDQCYVNCHHLIVYGYLRHNKEGLSEAIQSIEWIIYSYFTFWDSSVTDDAMIIQNNMVYRADNLLMRSKQPRRNAFSVRITKPYAIWRFKVIRCGLRGFWGILGVTKDNECGKNMGAWFMGSLNKSIFCWTGMNIVINQGRQIATQNDAEVKVGDIYQININLKNKTLIFIKNNAQIHLMDNICIENGYRIAVAFSENDCIMKL
eukprot:501896_1